MTANRIFRCLLWLYPLDYRRQFSEEMASVFEQRQARYLRRAEFCRGSFYCLGPAVFSKELFLCG
jgi:hypothetical protein